jgi:hypothetical protein
VRDTGVPDSIDRLHEPTALMCPDRRKLAAAVYLLGHVRQMEVRAERPHQLRRGRRVHLRE